MLIIARVSKLANYKLMMQQMKNISFIALTAFLCINC